MYDQVSIEKKDTYHERTNVFVVRTCGTRDAETYLLNECKAFRRLKGPLELMEFYASFRQLRYET